MSRYSNISTDGQGDYRRLRVDVGQTGFFAGREFRMFHEFTIASGANKVIKIVSPVNFILQTLSAYIFLAELRVEFLSGGTEGGSFSTSIPTYKTNTMTTASDYSGQITISTGGTHTGGTLLDVFELYSGTPANQALLSLVTESLPVGLPAGTYYIKLTNTNGDTTEGVFNTRYEERPIGV